ncbi:hypothetical protein [uncultured Thiodictyon sp.]|uniref:hypothetical protein n=1 Tax=uncultured Thiodictyon sp. TaxID=1846217 RepID=UPI003414CE9C
MIYRLADAAYGRPEVQPLTGETAVAAIAGLRIAWPAAAETTGAAHSELAAGNDDRPPESPI